MLAFGMRPHGSYKRLSRNRAFEAYLQPSVRSARRVRRIVDSLRDEIVDRPELGYQRTTLLDRAALEELLAAEEVRSRLRSSPLGG
jgi:hypothetical protein